MFFTKPNVEKIAQKGDCKKLAKCLSYQKDDSVIIKAIEKLDELNCDNREVVLLDLLNMSKIPLSIFEGALNALAKVNHKEAYSIAKSYITSGGISTSTRRSAARVLCNIAKVNGLNYLEDILDQYDLSDRDSRENFIKVFGAIMESTHLNDHDFFIFYYKYWNYIIENKYSLREDNTKSLSRNVIDSVSESKFWNNYNRSLSNLSYNFLATIYLQGNGWYFISSIYEEIEKLIYKYSKKFEFSDTYLNELKVEIHDDHLINITQKGTIRLNKEFLQVLLKRIQHIQHSSKPRSTKVRILKEFNLALANLTSFPDEVEGYSQFLIAKKKFDDCLKHGSDSIVDLLSHYPEDEEEEEIILALIDEITNHEEYLELLTLGSNHQLCLKICIRLNKFDLFYDLLHLHVDKLSEFDGTRTLFDELKGQIPYSLGCIYDLANKGANSEIKRNAITTLISTPNPGVKPFLIRLFESGIVEGELSLKLSHALSKLNWAPKQVADSFNYYHSIGNYTECCKLGKSAITSLLITLLSDDTDKSTKEEITIAICGMSDFSIPILLSQDIASNYIDTPVFHKLFQRMHGDISEILVKWLDVKDIDIVSLFLSIVAHRKFRVLANSVLKCIDTYPQDINIIKKATYALSLMDFDNYSQNLIHLYKRNDNVSLKSHLIKMFFKFQKSSSLSHLLELYEYETEVDKTYSLLPEIVKTIGNNNNREKKTF